jgi:hypothetical protein
MEFLVRTGGRNKKAARSRRAFGNADLERVGCWLPWEEGEEIGLEFCRVRSRIFPEVWVADLGCEWER